MEKNLKKYIYIYTFIRIYTWASQVVLVVKNPPANAADIRDLASPVFLPGESQGLGSLVGCRVWGRTESDTTEVT